MSFTLRDNQSQTIILNNMQVIKQINSEGHISVSSDNGYPHISDVKVIPVIKSEIPLSDKSTILALEMTDMTDGVDAEIS